jgi:hypothetical protein
VTRLARSDSELTFGALWNRRRRFRRFMRMTLYLGVVACLVSAVADPDNEALVEGLALVALVGAPAISIVVTRRLFRRSPRLLLLLRPFGDRSISAGLKSLVMREICVLGIPLTLADADINPPKRFHHALGSVARAGGLLTGWLAPSILTAETNQGLNQLEAIVHTPWRLAWLWLLSRRGLLVVPAEHRFWQDTVRLLARASDLVVVDVSEAGTGVVWEFTHIRREVSLNAVLFVAAENRLADARRFVGSFFPAYADDILGYRNDGSFLNRSEFLRILTERCDLLQDTLWTKHDGQRH